MARQGIAARAIGDNSWLSPIGPGHTDRCRAYRAAYRERNGAATASVCCCTREDTNHMELHEDGAAVQITDAAGRTLYHSSLAYLAVSHATEPEVVRFSYSIAAEFDEAGFPTEFVTRYARLVVESMPAPDERPQEERDADPSMPVGIRYRDDMGRSVLVARHVPASKVPQLVALLNELATS